MSDIVTAIIAILFVIYIFRKAINAGQLALNGKKLAVLGARGVGKTSLISFLSNGSLPEDYRGTIFPIIVKGRQVRVKNPYIGQFGAKNISMDLKDMQDVPGAKADQPAWKRAFNEAEIVLYLFRADQFYKGDKKTKDRISDDVGQFKIWLDTKRDEHKALPLIFLVATHSDRMPELEAPDRLKYIDSLRSHRLIQEALSHLGAKEIFFPVSLKTKQGAEKFAGELFYQIKKIYK